MISDATNGHRDWIKTLSYDIAYGDESIIARSHLLYQWGRNCAAEWASDSRSKECGELGKNDD
jgi:hypothetical protein